MKYGVREICDVVLRAKEKMVVGDKIFYKHEPVIYFDTLKTSSLEGASTTVYAQGGRGNARLMAWEGERTVTFNMEDALISPVGFMILSGAGLVDAANAKGGSIKVHTTEPSEIKVDGDELKVELDYVPYVGTNTSFDRGYTDDTKTMVYEHYIYVMRTQDGEVVSEPYLPSGINYMKKVTDGEDTVANSAEEADYAILVLDHSSDDDVLKNGDSVLVDYYREYKSDAFQIDITPDSFGGNFYLEASTLFRDTNGMDKPAEFIIPNCKIQSNFTFTMASSGDPSSFNFVMDAFPDYTRFDNTKKVLAAIQIIGDTSTGGKVDYRVKTKADIED